MLVGNEMCCYYLFTLLHAAAHLLHISHRYDVSCLRSFAACLAYSYIAYHCIFAIIRMPGVPHCHLFPPSATALHCSTSLSATANFRM